MRPGRLDRILYAGPPDFEARCEIFRIQLRKMSVDPTIDPERLARVVSDYHFPNSCWNSCQMNYETLD
jgi:AAA family ATPase